jgi:hypothetical protein
MVGGFDADEDVVVPSAMHLYRMLIQNQSQLVTFQQQQIEFQNHTNTQLAKIADILSQAKGGWRVFLMIGTALGGVLAGLGALLNHLHIYPFR